MQLNYKMAFYSYFKWLYDAMCEYMPEDTLLNVPMTLHNCNYFTTIGYVSNKMTQKQLLEEKKQFAASVQKPNYTQPLKISKLLQLETWPVCKNATKCQLPTVWFKPDITLVVGGDDGGDDGSASGGGDGRDHGDGNDDDDDDNDDD